MHWLSSTYSRDDRVVKRKLQIWGSRHASNHLGMGDYVVENTT